MLFLAPRVAGPRARRVALCGPAAIAGAAVSQGGERTTRSWASTSCTREQGVCSQTCVNADGPSSGINTRSPRPAPAPRQAPSASRPAPRAAHLARQRQRCEPAQPLPCLHAPPHSRLWPSRDRPAILRILAQSPPAADTSHRGRREAGPARCLGEYKRSQYKAHSGNNIQSDRRGRLNHAETSEHQPMSACRYGPSKLRAATISSLCLRRVSSDLSAPALVSSSCLVTSWSACQREWWTGQAA
jgi:hypothetical protein